MKNRPYSLPVRKLPYWKLQFWIISRRSVLLGLLVVLAAAVMTGCSPAPEPAPAATETQAPPPTATVAPPLTPTNTVLPSQTPTQAPTATTAPTHTATPAPVLAVVQDGVTAWCVSYRDPDPMGGSAETPSYARMARLVNGKLNLHVSRGSCTFVFTFNLPLPAGAELQVLNANGGKAWTKAPLNPVSSDPRQGFASLTHPMLNNPSYWQITYPFALVASDGSVLWKSNVLLYRTFPGLCWEGSTPDPVTLFCPLSDTDFIPNYKSPTPVR